MPLSLASTSRCLGVVALGAALAAACNVDPEGGGLMPVTHCAAEQVDATCVANYANRPYCSLCADQSDNQGCVSSPPVAACAPEGGPPIPSDGSGGDDDGQDVGSSTSSGGDGDTLPVEDTTSADPDTTTG